MRSVIVLGMHRSGTSAVSGMLRFLGLSHGPARFLMPSHNTQNPRGFWEQLPIVQANDAILAAAGGRWDAPPDREALQDPDSISEATRAALSNAWAQVAAEGPIVAKDPRLCLTLGHWLPVMGEAPVLIIVWRHPSEVAASLEARDGIEQGQSVQLWIRYNWDAIWQSDGLPRIGIRFDRLMANPTGTAERLRRWLDGQGVRVAAQVDVDGLLGFLDPAGRHHRPTEFDGKGCREVGAILNQLEWLPQATHEEATV